MYENKAVCIKARCLLQLYRWVCCPPFTAAGESNDEEEDDDDTSHGTGDDDRQQVEGHLAGVI